MSDLQVVRYRYADEWAAAGSSLVGASPTIRLDTTLFTSRYQHPSIVPNFTLTGGSTTLGRLIRTGAMTGVSAQSLSPGNAWTQLDDTMYTTQANDYLQFTVGAGSVQVILKLTGALGTGQGFHVGASGLKVKGIRNGALCNVLVNSVLVETVDLYLSAPDITLTVNAGDVVRVQHSGLHNAAFTPGGDSIYVCVRAITVSTGTGSNTGSYVSAVIDTLDTQNKVILLEWDQGTSQPPAGTSPDPTTQVTLKVGNTPTPDGTWTTQIVPVTDFTLSDCGIRMGMCGFPNTPRARYAQWQLDFAGGITVTPYLRDLYLYYWNPTRDTTLTQLGLAKRWRAGPLLQNVTAPHAIDVARTRLLMLDLQASKSIGGAVDAVLAALGEDFDLPQYTGEPPGSYRTRLQVAFNSRAQSGSGVFIATLVAQLVSGVTPTITVNSPTAGGNQTIAASASTLTTGNVTLGQTGAQTFSMGIPPPVSLPNGSTRYPGLAGLTITEAQQVIRQFIRDVLTPVNAVVSGSFVGTPGTI